MAFLSLIHALFSELLAQISFVQKVNSSTRSVDIMSKHTLCQGMQTVVVLSFCPCAKVVRKVRGL